MRLPIEVESLMRVESLIRDDWKVLHQKNMPTISVNLENHQGIRGTRLL